MILVLGCYYLSKIEMAIKSNGVNITVEPVRCYGE